MSILYIHQTDMDVLMFHLQSRILTKISKLIASIGGSIVNLPQVSENGTHKVMYCHDIDGIIVELVQEL